MGESPEGWPPDVKAIYLICNPHKEKARFQRLAAHLLRLGIPANRTHVCGPTWGSDLSDSMLLQIYDPFLPRGKNLSLCFKAACLSKGELSLTLNFYAALHTIQSTPGLQDTDSILFLESDTYLRTDFIPRLRDVLREARETHGGNWDYISLGDGCGTRPPAAKGDTLWGQTRLYAPPHQCVFRCTDSMLFRVGFLKQLAPVFLPVKEALDWELNYKFAALRGRAFWADPPLAEQGTLTGRLATSLPA
jgi:hypothetical protein